MIKCDSALTKNCPLHWKLLCGNRYTHGEWKQ